MNKSLLNFDYSLSIRGVIFLVLIMFGIGVFAQGPVMSEFFYQTDRGENVLVPEFRINSTTIEFENGAEVEKSEQILGLNYEKGISQRHSAGVSIAYTNATQQSSGVADIDVSGLNDVSFFAKGRQATQENQSLHYGINLSVSPQARKFDNDEVNANSGGNAMTPYIGYQWLLGEHLVGARFNTDVSLGDRSVEVDGDDVNESGGEDTALSLFYESPSYYQGRGRLGLAGSYQYTENVERGDLVTEGGYNSLGLTLYSPFRLTESAELLAQLNFSQIITASSAGQDLDIGNNSSLYVAGRFNY